MVDDRNIRGVVGTNIGIVDRIAELAAWHELAAFRPCRAQRHIGRPFSDGDMLRDLQERGALTRDDAGHWVVAPNLDWSSLPARVEGAIGERANRLEARLREILQIASVEGEEYTAELVAQVLGGPSADWVLLRFATDLASFQRMRGSLVCGKMLTGAASSRLRLKITNAQSLSDCA